MKTPNDMLSGCKHKTNNSGHLTIEKYISNREVAISFESGYRVTTRADCIRAGTVKDKSKNREAMMENHEKNIKISESHLKEIHDLIFKKELSKVDSFKKILTLAKEMSNRTPADMRAGTEHRTNNSGKLRIIRYYNHSTVDVEFIATGAKKTTNPTYVRRGLVRDRSVKS